MEINLRREMVKWLAKRGHWVVIRSSVSTRYSSSMDRESGQPYKIGEGTHNGIPYSDYIVRSFKSKVVPDIEASVDVGTVNIGTLYFYFEYYLPIKEGDLILEVELNEAGDVITPVKVSQAYKVLDPETMRDGASITPGRLEFFQARVEKVNVR